MQHPTRNNQRARILGDLAGRFAREESGLAAVLVAVSLVALIGFLGIVLDAGVLFVQRTQLQKAADAAALAGAYDIWPGDGTNNSIVTNGVVDAVTYAADDGVAATEVVINCAGVGGVCGQDVFNPGDAWTVTLQRKVPQIFAPVVGASKTGTVTATATAVNSPLSQCDSSCVLPYAIWGGNTPVDKPNGQKWKNYANRWCANVSPSVPPPCVSLTNVPPIPPIPSPQNVYNYQTLVLKASNRTTLEFRSNSWSGGPQTSEIVPWPDPNSCGGNNQLPCNANWAANPNTAFNGFFNNMPTTLTTDTTANLYSKGGNGTGQEPWTEICQIASSTNNDAIFPIIDWATTGFQFHIAGFIALKLNAPSGCSGGNQMGQNPFTGTIDWGATIPHGKGNGNANSPVHVLELWQ